MLLKIYNSELKIETVGPFASEKVNCPVEAQIITSRVHTHCLGKTRQSLSASGQRILDPYKGLQ